MRSVEWYEMPSELARACKLNRMSRLTYETGVKLAEIAPVAWHHALSETLDTCY